ncbi:MAG: hypothetical protein N7Q72_04795 [Spiroplasma sp. Tabriz.8]|nr:hypothetical protein [Spiroplasma sp. Tabriz.8]
MYSRYIDSLFFIILFIYLFIYLFFVFYLKWVSNSINSFKLKNFLWLIGFRSN